MVPVSRAFSGCRRNRLKYSRGDAMHWIAPSEKDIDNAALEERLWDATDQFRACSGLEFQEYSAPVLGLIFLRSAEVRFAAPRRAQAGERGCVTSPRQPPRMNPPRITPMASCICPPSCGSIVTAVVDELTCHGQGRQDHKPKC
jgi:hypothetical protein